MDAQQAREILNQKVTKPEYFSRLILADIELGIRKNAERGIGYYFHTIYRTHWQSQEDYKNIVERVLAALKRLGYKLKTIVVEKSKFLNFMITWPEDTEIELREEQLSNYFN